MAKRENAKTVKEAMRDAEYTTDQMIAILDATSRKICAYPELIKELGADVALLLCQMEWRWRQSGKQTFYKYIDECSSCREGDSWAAELGLTRRNIETALRIVGTRVKGKKNAEKLLEEGTELEHIIISYVPSKGAAQWYFNERLFLKLRTSLIFPDGAPILQKVKLANPTESEIGQYDEKGNTYSEPTQNQTNISGEEEPNIFEDESKWDTNVDEEKRQKNKQKVNQTYTKQQRMAMGESKRGIPMPLDFSVSPSTIERVIEEEGEEREWVEWQAKKFVTHYTLKNRNKKVTDWNALFVGQWIPDGKEYKRQSEAKYGKSGTTKSAGAERLDRLEELATTDIFGDTSFEDLGRSLYEDRYGSDESGIDS